MLCYVVAVRVVDDAFRNSQFLMCCVDRRTLCLFASIICYVGHGSILY